MYLDNMDFQWAKQYPEIYKICRMFQMSEVSNPIKYCYKSLGEYIQDGPQCGLVALAMCINSPDKDTVHSLYTFARNQGYTYNGEIFSAADMANLAKEYLPTNTQIKVLNSNLDTIEVREFLLNGGNILVPFDIRKDNYPGLCNGHKAHWAVISGSIQTDSDFYVLARHGKAKNVGIWKLSSLAESNSQLFEFSPSRKLQDREYKLPEGGISGPLGLNNKSVLIKYL